MIWFKNTIKKIETFRNRNCHDDHVLSLSYIIILAGVTTYETAPLSFYYLDLPVWRSMRGGCTHKLFPAGVRRDYLLAILGSLHIIPDLFYRETPPIV